MLHPPFRCALHMTCIDIETATQSLEDSAMPLLYLLHQQFLLWRPHSHEYHIRFLLHNIVYQSSFLFIRLDIAVTITHYSDILIFRTQFLYGLIYDLRFSTNQIECLFLVKASNNL